MLGGEVGREAGEVQWRRVRLGKHRRNRNGKRQKKGIAAEREIREDKKQPSCLAGRQAGNQGGREEEASAQKLSANGFVKAS